MSLLLIIIFNTRSGTNQNDASRYSIVKLYFEQPNEQPNRQATDKANEHIITKLDLLFNYLIYNNAQKKFEDISQNEKDAIVKILKRLDIFIENPSIVLKYFSEEQKLEYKIQYWAIKEIYFSSLSIFLNDLTREQFILRFLKAKKYMKNSNSINEFLNYFIFCLQEEMAAAHKIADRKSLKKEGEEY